MTVIFRWHDFFFLSQQKCLKPFIILVKVMKHKCFRKTSCLKLWTQSWTFSFSELHFQGWFLNPPQWQHCLEQHCFSCFLSQDRSIQTIPHGDKQSQPHHKEWNWESFTYLYWKPQDKHRSITLMLHLQKQVVIAKKTSEQR